MKSLLLTALLLSFSAAHATTQRRCGGGGGASVCSDSATLTLSGVVAPSCDVEVVAAAKATTLNIAGGETNTNVANVTEATNSPSGFDLSISSLNNGRLARTGGGASVAYQLSYDGGPNVTPSTTPGVVKSVASIDGVYTHTSAVNITFPAAAVPAGDYSDVVTVTMTAL